jgi:peptidoglycan/LPS O-acetylase OafA/YrhL
VRSLEAKIAAADGRPSGFDYLRLVLATGVILTHSFAINLDPAALNEQVRLMPVLRVPIGYIVPMFFALSGFLVGGSLQRSRSLLGFLGLRGLRIVPALAMEVTLSALILGSIFTTLPLRDYFADRQFWTYFLNMAGDIHYFLPGVFRDHPWVSVNAQLWTVPIELYCYAALAGLALIGVARRPKLMMGAVLLLQIVMLARTFIWPAAPASGFYHSSSVIACFLYGVLLYGFRDRVPWSWPLFVLSTAAMIVLLTMPWGECLFGLPAAYMAVFLGAANPKRSKIALSGDYSYGLYLYGFPIQQAVYGLGRWTHSWEVNFLVSFPAALVFAVISWRLVEKPALSLRGLFSRAPPSIEPPVGAESGRLSRWISRLPGRPRERQPQAGS